MLPRFVYRVDSRPPEVIFNQGIEVLGQNLDIVEHISGTSNIAMMMSGLNSNDGYISTSAVIENAVRWLDSFSNRGRGVITPRYMWVYEIRPTDDFYQLERTVNNLVGAIENNEITFAREEDRIDVLNILTSYISRINASQEWFTPFDINNDIIVSARRIDMSQESPNNLPYIEPNVEQNPNYVDLPSNANPDAFVDDNILETSNVNRTSVWIQEGHLGYIAHAGSFVFFNKEEVTITGQSNEAKKDDYIKYFIIPNQFIEIKTANLAIDLIYKSSRIISQQIPMIDVKDNNYKYKLSNYNYQITNADWAYLTEKKDSSPWLIYDQHKRLGYFALNKLIFFCLDAGGYHDGDQWNYLRFNPAISNYEAMQWDLVLSEDKKYLRLKNKKFPNLILGYKKGYLIIQKADQGYDEMAIDWKMLSIKSILDQSYVNNNYEWFDLRWAWNGKTYFPNLDGGSFASRKNYHILFFREFGYILCIDNNNGSIYALTNKRANNEDWNWIKWELLDGSEFINLPTNINRMWKIDYINQANGIVKINSMNQNDILWIQTHSTNWGYYFTSKKDKDYSDKASIQHYADWKK